MEHECHGILIQINMELKVFSQSVAVVELWEEVLPCAVATVVGIATLCVM